MKQNGIQYQQQQKQQTATLASGRRAYASTKPARKTATTGAPSSVVQRTNMGYSRVVIEKAGNQLQTTMAENGGGRAQSTRRNVPGHLFHPGSQPQEDRWGSPGVKKSSERQPQSSSKKKLAYISVVNQEPSQMGANAELNLTDLSNFQMSQTATASAYQSMNDRPHQNHGTIHIISRDHIQPPPNAQQKTQRQPSTGKRRSVLQNKYMQESAAGKVVQVSKSKSNRNNYNNLDPAYVQKRLQNQIETIKTMASLEKLPGNRKNSSLSRREQQQHQLIQKVSSFAGDEEEELRGGPQLKRRRGQGASSVPRGQKKKTGSNMRNVQTTLSNPNNTSAGAGMQRIGQKYGYKYGNNGGPLEAYSASQNGALPQQQLMQQTHQVPSQQIFTSIEGRTLSQKAGALRQQPGISKKFSANQIVPQAIQISQDINPLSLQHLGSIDRAQSIDSACYDFSTSGYHTIGAAGVNPVSAGLTPKTGKASDHETDPALQARNLQAPGFSEVLLQRTLQSRAGQANSKRNSLNPGSRQPSNQGQYAVDPQLEAALLSLDQSQVTQTMMKDFLSGAAAFADTDNGAARKASAPYESSHRLSGAGIAGQPNANSALESLVQQLIGRKEITQSPNIQQQQRRPHYNAGGQPTAAHQSLQPAHHQIHYNDDGVAAALSQGQDGKANNNANSLHGGGILLKQEHSSAEDLLRIGRRQDERSAANGSPQRTIPVKQQQPLPQAHLALKTFRPSLQPEGSQQATQHQKQQQQRLFYSNQYAAASFGKISGAQPTQPNLTENTQLDLDLSDTFGFPSSHHAGQTQPIGFGANQTISAISSSVVHDANTTVAQQLDLQTIDQSSIRGDLNASTYVTNRQKFLSLDQPQLPSTKTALASEPSIGDVYHKTLSAYQNDINQLNEINRTRKELTTRVMKQQYILQSIQGAATKFGASGAPSSASAVLMDSVANTSTVQQSKEPFGVIGGGTTISMQDQPTMQIARSNVQQQLSEQQRIQLAQQMSSSANNYNTVIVADPSHRNSLVDSRTVDATSLDPPRAKKGGGQQPQQVTTSPIVGRYRLKHVQQNAAVANAKQAHQGVASKRQYQYEGQSQRAATDKRTRSVRPRRPNNGQMLGGGGSNLRGGGRAARDDRDPKQQTMGTGVRSKFDSIAQAYHSTTQHNVTGRQDDYVTSSQRSFGAVTTGAGALLPGPLGPTLMDPQQAMVTLNPSQQLLLNPTAQQRQMHTIDPSQQQPSQPHILQQQQKSATLQQTYGVAQKLNSTSATGHATKRSTGGASVPRQRHRTSGFNSNLRPPVSSKHTERSLSTHNRNRAQHSFKQTKSFVAQHTYMSVGSGASIGSQQQAPAMQHLHGSMQYPVTTNRAAEPESLDAHSAVSPINTQQTRAFKYRAKQVAPAATLKQQRAGKGKQGRGALVANSTQLVGPASRKQSRIIAQSSGANNREARQIQLSQQQAQELRGSLLQHQVQPGGAQMGINFSRDNNQLPLADSSRLSPDRTLAMHQRNTLEAKGNATPEPLQDLDQMSPEQKSTANQHNNSKLKLLNKITRKRLEDNMDDLASDVRVGGQEIGGHQVAGAAAPQQNATAQQPPPLGMRTHNLRYSSAVNDFSQIPPGEQSGSPMIDDGKVQQHQTDITDQNSGVDGGSKAPNHRISDLSEEAMARQNQAMKLINEDNPFENPAIKEATLPHKSIAMLTKAAAAKAGDSSHAQQVESFGGLDSSKSMADKTTERESKNTNVGVSSSAAASGAPFTFSKQSQNHRRMIIAAGNSNIGGVGNNPSVGGGIVGRRSLLGMAAMRRSETTEDSQQCMYNDGALIMSSLPMPMHSIKQVIAEEEAAEEQDERTTNKESNKLTNKASSGVKSPHDAAAPTQKNISSGNQTSSNKEDAKSGTPKISSSDNVELTVNKQNSSSEPPNMGSQISLRSSIKDETNHDEQEVTPDISAAKETATEVKGKSESPPDESQDNLVMMVESPNQQSSDLELLSKKRDVLDRPPSQKQSDRYHSERGNNILCESEDFSVQHIEDSAANVDNLTPDILMNKNNNTFKEQHHKNSGSFGRNLQQRGSYNRGAFQRNSPDRLLADYPPILSESSRSKRNSNKGSDAHSDDEVEVRRGLESEHARTDMGSNPELLRQSTHSLLHKQQNNNKGKDDENEDNKDGTYAADMLILKQPVMHADDSDDNLICDEINVDLSRSGRMINVNKPGQKARNNNYFAAEPTDRDNLTSPKQVKTNKGKVIDIDSDEEEDEGIVGQVDDAEEFKLGKIV